jgi:hypothetical protein
MVTSDFRGFAMTLNYLEKKEVYAKLKHVKVPPAKHLLYGINQLIRLVMGGVNCMAVFQLGQGLKAVKRLYEPAIKGGAKIYN